MLEDEFHPQPRDNVTEVISWATPMGVVYAMFGGGIALAIASIIAPTEPAGRFLLALAVIGLFVMGGPRPASASPPGCDRRRGNQVDRGAATARPPRVHPRTDRPRASRPLPASGSTRPRCSRSTSSTVPTDTEKLLIFGRWDLGTSPEDVLDVLAVHGLVPAREIGAGYMASAARSGCTMSRACCGTATASLDHPQIEYSSRPGSVYPSRPCSTR